GGGGGIVISYPPEANSPHGLEFFGDEVESIRRFPPYTQRSLGAVDSAEITALSAPTDGQTAVPDTGHLCDYLPAGSWTLLVEPEELHEQGKLYLERVADPRGLFSTEGVFQQLWRFPSIQVTALPSPSVEVTCHLRVESVERFSGDVSRVRDELDSIAAADRVLIACHNEAECNRLGEVLAAGKLAQS